LLTQTDGREEGISILNYLSILLLTPDTFSPAAFTLENVKPSKILDIEEVNNYKYEISCDSTKNSIVEDKTDKNVNTPKRDATVCIY
jgi:hypothetical protein